MAVCSNKKLFKDFSYIIPPGKRIINNQTIEDARELMSEIGKKSIDHDKKITEDVFVAYAFYHLVEYYFDDVNDTNFFDFIMETATEYYGIYKDRLLDGTMLYSDVYDEINKKTISKYETELISKSYPVFKNRIIERLKNGEVAKKVVDDYNQLYTEYLTYFHSVDRKLNKDNVELYAKTFADKYDISVFRENPLLRKNNNVYRDMFVERSRKIMREKNYIYFGSTAKINDRVNIFYNEFIYLNKLCDPDIKFTTNLENPFIMVVQIKSYFFKLFVDDGGYPYMKPYITLISPRITDAESYDFVKKVKDINWDKHTTIYEFVKEIKKICNWDGSGEMTLSEQIIMCLGQIMNYDIESIKKNGISVGSVLKKKSQREKIIMETLGDYQQDNPILADYLKQKN